MTENTFALDEALDRLSQITSTITSLQKGDESDINATLDRIARNAVEMIPGAVVTIWSHDPIKGNLDLGKRVTAGTPFWQEGDDPCQADGLAVAVLQQQIRQISRQLALNPARGQTACFPLLASGELFGVLSASRPGGQQFQPIELAWLEHMSGLAALTLSLAFLPIRAQEEQARRERQLRRLRRAGMLISSRSSLQETLDTILGTALEVTDASYGIFRLVDRSTQYLVTRSFAGIGLAKPAVENLPISDTSVMGYVARNREPVVISDLHEAPWKEIYYPLDYEMDMRSEVAVPLIGASGRLEGVLNLESPEINAFDKEDRYILQILATQAVIAIQEVRLLDTLQDIAAMLHTHSLEVIHQSLVERACDLLNVPTSLIWLQDKERLVVRAASDKSFCGQSIALGRGPTSRAIQSAQPVSILELHEDDFDLPGLEGAGSALFIPFSTGSDKIMGGVFSVYSAQGDLRDFGQSDWDKRVISILGHYDALAVQNSAHLEALRLAEDQRATTETFAAIGDIAANLLHRLNNKVGTIPVRVEGIQDKCEALILADPYLAANLTEIQRSAAEAMQVVSESLEHLRPIQLGPVSVSACVQNAIASTQLPSEVRVETQGLECLPPVQAGADRLGLVFTNLLENAAEAMGPVGEVRILGNVQDKWVEIQVSDTGPGIPPELHERIFEFNYSSRASHPGKLGFGLWWVKSWVTRFGGRIAVESAHGRGTTFILSLPLAEGEA
jgi:signal transduction histidine kinase/putative methionine-R-sulfoxide reductase with GAF domain